MSARRAHGRRSHEEHEEHENEERWLISYADMVTLLMCLFMVLFAISSVNTSKWEALSKSLKESFSGQILTGGKSIQHTGASADETEKSSPEPPIPAIMPMSQPESPPTQKTAAQAKSAAEREQSDFSELKRRVDAYARDHGLSRKMDTQIARRGLVIRLLTDGVLFGSGSARLQPGARPLLGELSRLLVAEVRHPIGVEGHTDSAPIRTERFPDNWELSTARATSVVRSLIGGGVNPRRLQASGVADERPISTNATDAGRARNRRVEIVLHRLESGIAAGSQNP